MTDPTAKGCTAPTEDRDGPAFRHDPSCDCFGCAKDCVGCTCSKLPAKAAPESIYRNQIQAMRGRPVRKQEALESAQRLINSHFHNEDTARVSIPANPADDDLIVMDFIRETPNHKPAPESEEEAFELAWNLALAEYEVSPSHGDTRSTFRAGWNARARLNAERGK